jgi:hypothetical protein
MTKASERQTLEQSITDLRERLAPYDVTCIAATNLGTLALGAYHGFLAGTGTPQTTADRAVMTAGVFGANAALLSLGFTYAVLTHRPLTTAPNDLRSKLVHECVLRLSALSMGNLLITQATAGVGYCAGYTAGYLFARPY